MIPMKARILTALVTVALVAAAAVGAGFCDGR
jgi:hypothetical protein